MKENSKKEAFKRIIQNKSLGHAYILEGPRGSGKKDFALWLASCIFCEQPESDRGACGVCGSCIRLQHNNHPDLVQIEAEGASIKVDQIRELNARLARTGVESQGQVALIHDADKMTAGAANALLKILEEPVEETYLFLLTQAKNRLLKTIQSRCQEISFNALSPENIYQKLLENGMDTKTSQILSFITQDLDEAQTLYEAEYFKKILEKMRRFYDYLLEKKDMAFPYIQSDLLPLLKERDKQEVGLQVLLTFYRIDIKDAVSHLTDKVLQEQILQSRARGLSQVLEARKLFQAHVPFQASLEYLVLKILS